MHERCNPGVRGGGTLPIEAHFCSDFIQVWPFGSGYLGTRPGWLPLITDVSRSMDPMYICSDTGKLQTLAFEARLTECCRQREFVHELQQASEQAPRPIIPNANNRCYPAHFNQTGFTHRFLLLPPLSSSHTRSKQTPPFVSDVINKTFSPALKGSRIRLLNEEGLTCEHL